MRWNGRTFTGDWRRCASGSGWASRRSSSVRHSAHSCPGGLVGVVLPAAVVGGAFFFFLGTIAYGIVELYFIVRPRRSVRAPGTSALSGLRRGPSLKPVPIEATEEEGDAAS